MTYLIEKAGDAVGDLVGGIGDFASKILDRGFAIVDNILSDPKKLVSVGISIAFPGAAAAIGGQLGLTGTMATIVGNTALGSLANGGNIEEALKGAVLSAGAQELTNNLKIKYASDDISRTLTDIAAKTTTDVALATIMGKDPAAALLFGGVQAATQVITDTVLSATGTRETYDKLPKAARDAANAALSAVISGKNVAGATAQSIVTSALRGFSGAINIQNSSLRFTGKALDEKDLEKYVYNVSSDALANPTRAEDYFLSIEAAENYFGRELGKKEVALIAGLAPYTGELSTAEMFERLSGLEYSRSQLLDQISQTKGWEDYNDQVTAFSTGYQDPNSWRNYLKNNEANNAAIQTGWDSGGQEQYFNTRFNKSNSSDVANVLDDLAKITSGLSDGDRQWIIGQISGDGEIDETEAEKLQQILPALDQKNLSQLSPEEKFDDWKQISELVKTWDTSKSANENLQSIVSAPAPETKAPQLAQEEALNKLSFYMGKPLNNIPQEVVDRFLHNFSEGDTSGDVRQSTAQTLWEYQNKPELFQSAAPAPAPSTLEPNWSWKYYPDGTAIEVVAIPIEDGKQLVMDKQGNVVDIIQPQTPVVQPPAPVPEPSPLDVLGQPISEQKPTTTQDVLDVIQPIPTPAPAPAATLSRDDVIAFLKTQNGGNWDNPPAWVVNNVLANYKPGMADFQLGGIASQANFDYWVDGHNQDPVASAPAASPPPWPRPAPETVPSGLDVLGQPITPEAVTVEPKPTTVEEVIDLVKPQPEVVSPTPEPSQVTEPVTQPPAEVVTIPDGNGNQLVIDQTGNIVDIISGSPSEVVEPVVPTPEVITLPPDDQGNQYVIDTDGNLVDIIPPPEVVEPTETVTEPAALPPEVITLPPDENGNQFVIDQEGNVVDIIPPEQLPVDQEDTTVPPFQGPMGPMTEDQIKRYNDEFARYLDYLQAGQPAPPEYKAPPFNEPGPYWDEFNQNLLQMMQEGRLPSQWQKDEEGNFTFVSDDGSTLTIDQDGNIVHYTEAPMGNLPGETPATQTSTTQQPKTQTTTQQPSVLTDPKAQSDLGLLSLLPLLAAQKQPEEPKPFYSPTVEYVDIDDPFQIVGLNRNQNTRPIEVSSGGYLDELLAQLERRN